MRVTENTSLMSVVMVMALVMDVSDAVGDGGGYARNIRRNISDLFSFYILCF